MHLLKKSHTIQKTGSFPIQKQKIINIVCILYLELDKLEIQSFVCWFLFRTSGIAHAFLLYY